VSPLGVVEGTHSDQLIQTSNTRCSNQTMPVSNTRSSNVVLDDVICEFVGISISRYTRAIYGQVLELFIYSHICILLEI